MPLQDVSNDATTIGWLRQMGHGHLIEDSNIHNINPSIPPAASPPSFDAKYTEQSSAPQYPPQSAPVSSTNPLLQASFLGGANSNAPRIDSTQTAGSFIHNDPLQSSTYGSAGFSSPPLINALSNFSNIPINPQHSPILSSSPIQFSASNLNNPQLDVDFESVRRDPNTRVIQRPPAEDVVYKQRVFVRYLQPPTPPPGGTVIIREKQEPGPPPDPPIVIKRAPPPPPTPPPVIIRERPPPLPTSQGTTVIDKLIPPGPKPPPQVIIEQYPQLPQKPQDVIIERWLPMPPRQRRIMYERLPPASHPVDRRPIIVQYGPPNVRVHRELVTTPGVNLPFQKATGQTDIRQLLNQLGGQQSTSSILNSSLLGYNPYSSLQPSTSILDPMQPNNILIMQNAQPTTAFGSPYGLPLSCVCTPSQNAGLGSYGSGTSTIPMIGQSSGQVTVYNVPDNVSMDGVFRQLGIDPSTIQPSTGFSGSGSNSAISHNWNAALNASNQQRPGSPSVDNVWDRIERQLNPRPEHAVQSAWQQLQSPNGPHPSSNYPPSNQNYPPPQQNYPPPQQNYPPPQQNYPPPQQNYPPPQQNYPPPQQNYPPPQQSYPPPQQNYPPPQQNYPPSNQNYPPPQGGSSGAGASVLSRLFGGG